MQKIKKFFWYLFTNPVYTITYLVTFFKDSYICNIKLVEKEDLVKKIKNGVSLIRFGDGDIYISHGGNQSYQSSSKTLRKKLFEIFTSTYSLQYQNQEASFLIGIPSRYLSLSNKELKKNRILQCWLPFKIAFKHCFNSQAYYFDAHLFYQTGAFETYVHPNLLGKNVLFVSNRLNVKKLQKENIKPGYITHYLETKNEDSFEEYDTLFKSILEFKKKNDDLRVVLATGTTSKVLAYNLCKAGVICYDIGWGIVYTQGDNELEKQLIIG